MAQTHDLATRIKLGVYAAVDVIAGTAPGRYISIKTTEVLSTALGAGNHDDDGNRTGENRLISALGACLPYVTAVDVGANNGSWTLEVRQRLPRSHVIAVEPGSQALGMLIGRTGGDRHVTVIGAAIGATDGSATLWGTDSNLQASLLPEVLGRTTRTAAEELPGEVVRVLTFEGVLEEARKAECEFEWDTEPVNVVKIDIEGMELDVIGQIAASPGFADIEAIQFELHMHAIAQGHVIGDFQAALGEEFTLMRLSPRALIPMEQLGPGLANFFGFSNWVAVRRNHAPSLERAYRKAKGARQRPFEWRR